MNLNHDLNSIKSDDFSFLTPRSFTMKVLYVISILHKESHLSKRFFLINYSRIFSRVLARDRIRAIVRNRFSAQ